MRANVFVFGSDEHNFRILQEMPDAADCEFHPLLSFEDVHGEQISVPDVLASAQHRLDAFDGPIDAIIGFWDFPVSRCSRCCAGATGCPQPTSRR